MAIAYNLGFYEEVIVNLRNDGWEFVRNVEIKGKSDPRQSEWCKRMSEVKEG